MSIRGYYVFAGAFGALGAAACSGDSATKGDPASASDPPPGVLACAEDNGGITLPAGFCATVFADEVGRARQIAVTPSGDVFVAIGPARDGSDDGSVIALRDADRDGTAELVETAVEFGGNSVAWQDGQLYVGANERIVRFALPDGVLRPDAAPQLIVTGLPADGDHPAKTVVPHGEFIYVNHGSATNSCQLENRVLHSPGEDPCIELCERAGIWRYASDKLDQTVETGLMFATGVRNGNALGLDADGLLWTAVNGRDQLHENWPELFTPEQDLLLPSEEIAALREGDDRGWPYCYHDPFVDEMKLAPEYGGDGVITGRCGAIAAPQTSLPGHWAPLSLTFYNAELFPERYRGGMFVANHGSRFDMNAVTDNPGYNVVFIPFANGAPGDWEEFAAGFRGTGLPLPDAAPHRPVGLAVMPDGSLLVSDDKAGRIWKITYQPGQDPGPL